MQAKQKFGVVPELLGAVSTVVLLLVAMAAAHYRFVPRAVDGTPDSDLKKQIGEFTAQVERLKREQGMPASVLDRYRNSVGYIYGVYRVGFANQRPALRARAAGTGFLVGNGLVATNRHVAEPWYGDAQSEALIHRGASTTLETLVNLLSRLAEAGQALSCFGLEDFGSSNPAHGKLGCCQGSPGIAVSGAVGSPGQVVTLIGYPMGIAGMVAKSPSRVYERLTYRKNDISAAKDLAARSRTRGGRHLACPLG